MIYLDNAAETLPKPEPVINAVGHALRTFGNPGRSFTEPALAAAREIESARRAVAWLVGLKDPARVAFTSGFTESLNLISGMIASSDHVIATANEHNSVLRPLYRTGCELSIIPVDASGNLELDSLERLVRPNTRYLFACHGSNVTGNIIDPWPLMEFCRERGLTFVLDAAQTLGCAHVQSDMADIICFTGHKALLGPQGTGGIIAGPGIELPILKTGGTGSNSFERSQPATMPGAVEAGTQNAHGLAGLRAGIKYIRDKGMDAIIAREQSLVRLFYEGLIDIGATVYGDFERWPRLPVVSFELPGVASDELALYLWERGDIASRAGTHCAPLIHEALGTAERGLVRCSFSHTNTIAHVDIALHYIQKAVQG